MPNLRAPFAVVVDRTGAVLPTVGQDAPIRLDLAELNWLAVLAGSDPIEGVPTPLHTLAPLVAELAGREQSGSVVQLPEAPKSEALNPSIDDTFTIAPRPDATRCGNAAWASANGATRFRSSV